MREKVERWGIPLRLAPGPPGAIRERFAGRNLRTGQQGPVRPSGILSGTVVANRGPSVSSSFPSRLSVADPRPSGHGRKTQRYPFREKTDTHSRKSQAATIPPSIFVGGVLEAREE